MHKVFADLHPMSCQLNGHLFSCISPVNIKRQQERLCFTVSELHIASFTVISGGDRCDIWLKIVCMLLWFNLFWLVYQTRVFSVCLVLVDSACLNLKIWNCTCEMLLVLPCEGDNVSLLLILVLDTSRMYENLLKGYFSAEQKLMIWL